MSDGKLTPIKFAPGINKNSTDYNLEGRWVAGDKVRFRDEGRPEKIGGWQRKIAAQNNNTSSNLFTGCARKIISWQALNGNKYLALGTHLKLELFFNGQLFDITPIESSAASYAGTFGTTSGSSIVQITIASHARNVDDFVSITASSETTIGGVTVIGEYQVTEVVDVDNIMAQRVVAMEASSTASTATTINYSFYLPSGYCDAGNLPGGYGVGSWNTEGVSSGGWNEERISTLPGTVRTWALANFGEDLLANPRGGGIYTWDASAGPSSNPATLLSNAPAENNFIFVSEARRNVVSLGCTDIDDNFDPLLVRWSDTENSDSWDPTTPGTVAGSQRLPNGSKLVGGLQTRSENVIFSDTATYSMRFTGGDLVYSFNELGSKSGLIGPNAAIDVDGVVFWLGKNSFFRYDGAIAPIPCTLQKALFNPESEESINQQQKDKVYAGFNREFFEIIWHYPSRDSIECDRYVIYNYLYNTWYDGSMGRTAWEDRYVFDYPIAVGSSGLIYDHEISKNDDGNAMTARLESAYFEINEGDDLMFIDKFIPDFKKLANSIDVTFSMKKYNKPETEITVKGPYTVTNNTDFISFRARGRIAKVEYTVSTTDGDFEVGSPRIRITPDGGR